MSLIFLNTVLVLCCQFTTINHSLALAYPNISLRKKIDKMKKWNDWSDSVNDSCVALCILYESSVVRAFISNVGDLN